MKKTYESYVYGNLEFQLPISLISMSNSDETISGAQIIKATLESYLIILLVLVYFLELELEKTGSRAC